MYQKFNSREELYKCVADDKCVQGINSFTLNRYPLRFVLFDNFSDYYDFVRYLQVQQGVVVQSVDEWMDKDYPDTMITYIDLANRIKTRIKEAKGGDCVIAPFSELARFYDNTEAKIFDSLIKTIKSIEASSDGCEKSQRIYIPIVGLDGKMSYFINDPQITIWYLNLPQDDSSYRLVLTNDDDCFGVKDLDDRFLIVNNVCEWLNIWKKTGEIKKDIICKSRAIFAYAHFAQPDNAFDYVSPQNSYEFIKDALDIDIEGVDYKEAESEYWNLLAQQIDINRDNNISGFIKNYFGVIHLESYNDFIKLWVERITQFDRWLLKMCYMINPTADSYIKDILSRILDFEDSLVEQFVLTMSEIATDIEKRRYCLNYIIDKGCYNISNSLENTLLNRLQKIAETKGYSVALQYFTLVSPSEKALLINWLKRDNISIDNLKHIYPDLYYYLQEMDDIGLGKREWIIDYFKGYKIAKVKNVYTEEIKNLIYKHNESSVSFDTWYQSFKNVKTILSKREDIDVYYWIDGLGVDWIPYVSYLISGYKEKKLYINETIIAKSILPTKTENNKLDLQSLSDFPLEKIGDLDALAHYSGNSYPSVIIKELDLVKKSIYTILSKYKDKKVAIVSDHGLTYLSQLVEGLNLAGAQSDHNGRLATKKDVVMDNNYFILEDNKTICALKHKSLCAKVPNGQGAHGGCTPEEVLVPIFIISNIKEQNTYSTELLSFDVDASSPYVRFAIKGLKGNETLSLKYTTRKYKLKQVDTNMYESEALQLVDGNTQVVLCVNDSEWVYNININIGFKENDLFDF